MARALRWTGHALGGLGLLVVLALVALSLASGAKLRSSSDGRPEHLAAPTPAQLADAPRQMRILGCRGCHGEGLRGALFLDEPNVATIYAPNLTLVAAHATDQQLARAIRQGTGVDGRALAIMPSATYSHLEDGEVAALIAAIRALPRGGQPTPPRRVGIFGRIGLVTGKFHTEPELLRDYTAKLPADLGPNFARGRHLVASRCVECHGPDLTGGEIEGLKTPDLTIVGAYDLQQFTHLLRAGVPPGGRKLKLMGPVARQDFSHYTDEEIAAIHAYLVERAQRAP